MKKLFKVGAERHDVGKVTFSWHPEGNFLATAGKNGIIHITDRHGDSVDEIPMSTSAPVTSLEWDKDGEYLAILQDGNGVVPLWNLSSKRVVPLETNLKDPTFLAWSKTGPQLAIGTAKGSLLIYNKVRRQKIPIVGKHSKRIGCGAWSKGGNKLVLGSDDRTLTISNESGDTLLHTELKHIPVQTLFTNNKSSAQFSSSEDNTVSANLNGKSLLLYNIADEKEDPMELTFAPKENGVGCKYGEIVSHHWYEEGSLLVGFSSGYLISVSTGAKDLGEEKHMGRFHPSALFTLAFNPHSKRAATAGDDGVRIIDTRDFRESKKDYIPSEDFDDGRVTSICWSPDGQILTVGTTAGNVYNFLAKMSVLSAYNKSSVCYLSSLREISVVDCARRAKPIDITLKLEPAIIALGPKHVAAGMNNRVYYHRITPNTSSQAPINEQEYVGIAKEVQLSQAYSVILTDSKAIIHPIEPAPGAQSQTKTFPSREEGSMSKVTCIALTEEFLFYGTEAGTVEVFFLAEWVLLAGVELRLDPPSPIKKLFPNSTGSRVVVVDVANRSFLFNPVTGGGLNQSITQFDASPQNIINVIWDLTEKNVIIFFDGKFIHSYVYANTSIKGPLLIKLGPITVSSEGEVALSADKTEMVPGNFPLLSIGGSMTCQTVAGVLTTIAHPYFDKLVPAGVRKGDTDSPNGQSQIQQKKDKKLLGDRFCQALVLLKLESAWEVALELDRRQFWLALSGKAMEMMNIELAMRVYRQLGDAGMVMALQECVYIEDKNLLAGKISMLFGDYNRAQDLYLASSRPSAALDMRRDLLQWDQALKLAQMLNVNHIPEICLQYGQQLEFRDEVERALKMFEATLNTQDSDGNFVCPKSLIAVANMGVARCNLRLGNIRQGIRLANELDDKQLFIDSGEILTQQKQYSEAASMFIKGLQYEKAALIYTKYLIKNDKSRITEVAAIMDKVDNDNLNSDFAKACQAAGRYEDAAKAYERAKDMDKVVELKLRHLDQAQQAFDLVRQSASAQGAQFVAEYCQETNDYRGAIEFLLIANKSDEAFKLAQSQSIVDVYTGILGENIASEDAMKVASYYEKISNFGLAGRFYSLCGQYSRALKLFIQCGDKEIDSAIEVVGRSQNENLTHQLIDFLVGEKDGVPKDQNYIYRLYLALKKYDDAAKTALIIARSEQDAGNYALAHSVVVETIREFENAGMNVSLQLRQTFVLLHSYIIVKSLVRRGDHNGAARLLLRVVQSVSKFPAHVVQILTSTVIECQRAGLKASAYEYSTMLMRPEYRPSIDANLKRKIEAIVRRRFAQGEETQEDLSACPISAQLIPEYQLESPTTRDALPMCIITGKHMLLDDWCFCPISKFPALYSAYVKYIETEIGAASGPVASAADGDIPMAPIAITNISSKLSVSDPIHGKSVSISDLKLSSAEDAMKYIQRYNNVVEKKAANEDGGADKDGSVEGGQDGIDIGASPDGPNANAAKGKRKDGPGGGEGAAAGPSNGSSASRLKSDRAQRTKEKLKRNNGGDSNKS